MFSECGMEVYETMGTVWVEEERSEHNVERANVVSRVRESLEQVQQQLYAAYELMDRLDLEDNIHSEWRNGLIMYKPQWVVLRVCALKILYIDIGHGSCR